MLIALYAAVDVGQSQHKVTVFEQVKQEHGKPLMEQQFNLTLEKIDVPQANYDVDQDCNNLGCQLELVLVALLLLKFQLVENVVLLTHQKHYLLALCCARCLLNQFAFGFIRE